MNQRLHVLKKSIFATLVLFLITFSPRYAFVTVACRDTKDKVVSYMNEFKYTFPVAMNDRRLDKAYNVHGFPTKALITPAGNYLQIQFNSTDWSKFIERYVED